MPHLISQIPSETDNIKVGGDNLLLWRPIDAERLVLETTQAEFGTEERMPYWAILWPASLALADFLVDCVDLEGKEILELGAGLAVPALVAARAGAHVTASDWYAEPLEFIQSSARLNGLLLKTQFLDWTSPPTDVQYDLILGADLLYERRNHMPILSASAKMLKPGGKLFLTDPKRQTALDFQKCAQSANWNCKCFELTMQWEGNPFVIDLWELDYLGE